MISLCICESEDFVDRYFYVETVLVHLEMLQYALLFLLLRAPSNKLQF